MKIKILEGGNLRENGYIISVKEKGSCYIIDPGYDGSRFIKYIEAQNLNPKGILLTHHHYDHVGAVNKILAHFNIPVMIHELDTFQYKGKVDVVLKDNMKLDLDGESLQVRHTPGHTMGSCVIVSEKSRVVFSGDTIFDTDLGRTDLEDGSPELMVKSCKEVIDDFPNDYTIYPGHEGSATMKQIRKYNLEFLDCINRG